MDRITAAAWRLRRLRRVEAEVFTGETLRYIAIKPNFSSVPTGRQSLCLPFFDRNGNALAEARLVRSHVLAVANLNR